MIFPVLELEKIVQTDDKTRLEGDKSFISVDEAAITLMEIEPEASAGFIDVTSSKRLDWQYATDGTKAVSIRITTDGAPVTSTKDIEVITPTNDALFSADSDLINHEPDILEFIRSGRSSFLNVHRESQTRILAWLDEHRIWDTSGDRLTKAAVIDVEEVSQWSKFLTLQVIFEGLSNATDDIFHEKAGRYREMANTARNRGAIKLDFDGDGNQDPDEGRDLRSLLMVRR